MVSDIQIKNELLQVLKNRLMSIKPDVNITKEWIKNAYKPYVKEHEENLILHSKELKNFLDKCNYDPIERKRLKALRSSAALMFNTFVEIEFNTNLVFKNQVYNHFEPEFGNCCLKGGRGRAKIDALLKSQDRKSIMILEGKMFEHYDGEKAFLSETESYFDRTRYSEHLSSETIEAFVELFHEIKNHIENRLFTRFDIQQMAKHLLSIVNNLDSENKPFKKAENIYLIGVSWLASKTSIIDQINSADRVKKIDGIIEEEARLGVALLNKVLENTNLNKIKVSFTDYSTFIEKSNLSNHPHFDYLNKRYL